MTNPELALENQQGCTALSLAAAAGNVDIAKTLADKYPPLLNIRHSVSQSPLYLAALYEKRKMVSYLYKECERMSGDEWTDADRYWVFRRCIETDIFDVALRILEENNDIVVSQREDVPDLLDVLARKPYAFKDVKPHIIRRIINSITCVKPKQSEATKLLKIIWDKIMEMPNREIRDILKGPENSEGEFVSPTLFTAAEMGNTGFLVELIRKYPDLIWDKDDVAISIFHVGVSHRHESIYNLLHEIGSMKDMITSGTDSNGNNMLHLVGRNADRNALEDVSGAAFQMQRELLWFEEVKAMIPPSDRDKKNKYGHTPRQLFIESHTNLVSLGEKWMKGTASQCMVVAALTAAMVFSIAFTIPGGYDQTEGFPIFLHNGPFKSFTILDAISLILSSTSILIFLSILTSRYAQDDFLKSLPRKLIIGLSILFFSIVTMMISFTTSFFVVYRHKLISIPIIISVAAIVPIMVYVILQRRLFVDVFRSTYRSKYLLKPKRHMLYHQNPRF